jgi:hypothetical protein
MTLLQRRMLKIAIFSGTTPCIQTRWYLDAYVPRYAASHSSCKLYSREERWHCGFSWLFAVTPDRDCLSWKAYLLFLSQRSGVLVEAIAIADLANRLSAFCGTRKFVNVFTRVCDLTRSRATLIQAQRHTLFKKHFRIILPFTFTSVYRSVSLRMSHRYCMRVRDVSRPCCSLCVYHHVWRQ